MNYIIEAIKEIKKEIECNNIKYLENKTVKIDIVEKVRNYNSLTGYDFKDNSFIIDLNVINTKNEEIINKFVTNLRKKGIIIVNIDFLF